MRLVHGVGINDIPTGADRINRKHRYTFLANETSVHFTGWMFANRLKCGVNRPQYNTLSTRPMSYH